MPYLHTPLRASDRVISTEPGNPLVVVEREGRTMLADKFGNDPDLRFCDRCRARVPGVRDRTGKDHWLCYRCRDAMLILWLRESGVVVTDVDLPQDDRDTDQHGGRARLALRTGMWRDPRFLAWLEGFESAADSDHQQE